MHTFRSIFATIAALLIGTIFARAEMPPATVPATTPSTAKSVAGLFLPAPPRQSTPWQPPKNANLDSLGKFVDASNELFTAGMADPRGCTYSEINIHIGSVWSGDAGIVKTHGWVMSAQGLEIPPSVGKPPATYAVCWNGLVYPVESVGPKADLKADITALIKADEKARADSARDRGPDSFYRYRHALAESDSISHQSMLPDKACLLLRLGEVDLASGLWNAWRAGMKENTNDDAAHLKDSYLMLANDWVWALFDRAVTAHMRGDDALALTSARACAAAVENVEKTAVKRGFGQPDNNRKFMDFTAPLAALIPDTERRLSHPRATDDQPAAIKDPKARAVALIAQLDQVDARQDGQPGGVSLGSDPIVAQLISCGDPAIEPLIACLESDERLTRSVHFWRDFSTHRSLLGVHEAAYVALVGILEQSFFGTASTGDDLSARGLDGRRKIASAIREYWNKVKDTPKEERWYKALADDKVSPNEWIQVAENIVQPVDVQITPGSMFGGSWTTIPSRKPGEIPALRGESLRKHKDPSVTELLLKRAGQVDGDAAVTLMLALADWQGKDSLKDLVAFTHRLESAAGLDPRDASKDGVFIKADDRHVYNLLKLYDRRIALGDPDVLNEYAAFVRHVSPGSFGSEAKSLLKLMWRNPDHKALAASAEWMFTNPGSPWLKAGTEGGATFFATYELWTSPLVGVPAFQKQLLAMLDDTSDRGEIKLTSSNYFDLHVTNGWGGGYNGVYVPEDLKINPGSAFKFRTCDLIASQLGTLEGFPRCELYWPLERRDKAVAACKVFFKQYGARWAYDPVLSRDTWGDDRTRLNFSKLAAPATRDQVARGEAIFSHEGQPGEIKSVPLPTFPLRARWAANKKYAYDQVAWMESEQTKTRRYYQDGWIWQAEDLTSAGKTQRFYGFSGRFELAKVPAEEMELPADENAHWVELSAGLDVRITPPGQARSDDTVTFTALAPKSPLPLRVELRNRKAVPQTLTADLLEKKPLKLRAGITIHLAEPVGPEKFPNPYDSKQWRELKPLHLETFTPSAPAQSRAPGESWEAFQLDLHELFTITNSGSYALWITFDEKDSHLAAGTSERVLISLVKDN